MGTKAGQDEPAIFDVHRVSRISPRRGLCLFCSAIPESRGFAFGVFDLAMFHGLAFGHSHGNLKSWPVHVDIMTGLFVLGRRR
ncbi:hypothetical protein VTJ04DRAFT_8237 [Mycothermus thermophilus]|uniref:uncharacterized protein n=1 Tax=Humicola insolens TaxID=85995 RepID=UPI003742BF35